MSWLESPSKASVIDKEVVESVVCLEAACANEVSLIILDILDLFAQKFGVSGPLVWWLSSMHDTI